MDSKEAFDVDGAVRHLMELVETNLRKASDDSDHLFEWLADFQSKAKQRLGCATQDFKMPKTPAAKRTRKQKKRVFQQEDDQHNEGDKVQAAPMKKEKLSFEEEDLRESVGISRPRRQASCAAKSKIQHSLKMMNCTQKLRRPSSDSDAFNTSSVGETKDKQEVVEDPSVKSTTTRSGKTSVIKVVETEEASASKPSKAVRIVEAESNRSTSEVESMDEDAVQVEAVSIKEEIVDVIEKPKRGRPARKGKKIEETCSTSDLPAKEQTESETAPVPVPVPDAVEVMEEETPIVAPPVEEVKVEVEKPKRTRVGLKSRKAEEAVEEVVQPVIIPESPPAAPFVSPPPVPSAPQASSTPEPEVVERSLPVVEPEPIRTQEEKPKRTKPAPKSRKEPEEAEQMEEEITQSKPIVVEEEIEKPKRTRPGLKNKKTSESVAVIASTNVSEAESTTSEAEAVPKKRGRRAKPTTEEVSSPRVTRHRPVEVVQVTASETAVKQVVKPSRSTYVTTPSKKNPILEQAKTNNQFQSPSSASPIRKHFTPKLIFSPFKPSSVKTKVEAFEAALSGTAAAMVDDEANDHQTAVLPEARVVIQRLSEEELSCAGVHGQSPQLPSKRGTFVKPIEEVDSAPRNVPEPKSVTQSLARKSLEKAKKLALSVAKQNLLSNTLEGAESPNVHVNRNAANILSKYRFTNTSGSSGSSNSHVRHVPMTQARTLGNVVTSTSSLIPKPMAPLVTKVSEEEESRLKEEKLARLRAKEEEAARKREELNKAKAEEQKKKHDARAKRAMEQRALRAKRCEEEQKQKLETKEEKSALVKMEMQMKNQEKAEKLKQELLKKQHEAEQRRKEEAAQKQRERELQKQREKEEEQQRQLAAKKEQEEQEKLAKLKQAEAEKAKVAAAAPEKAKLNTTVTLPASNINNYQITPVRVHKTGKLVVNPDNYDITDMRSDDSTDDDSRPKKTIPSWARSVNLKVSLSQQATLNINTNSIFPPEVLLPDPNLNIIFPIKRPRFDKRTSSAVWKTPPANYM